MRLPPPDLAAAFRARFERMAASIRERGPEPLVLVQPKTDMASEKSLSEATADPRWWAPELPLPLSVGQAAVAAEAMAAEASARLVRHVEELVGALVVDARLRPAVLARLVSGWPGFEHPRGPVDRWPLAPAGTAASRLAELAAGLPPYPDAPSLGIYWPPEAAPLDVARWAHAGLDAYLERTAGAVGVGTAVVAAMEDPEARPSAWSVFAMDSELLAQDDQRCIRVPIAEAAILFLAERDVREGLRRPAVAVDAGKKHHDLLSGWRDLPRDGKRHTGASIQRDRLPDGRIELLAGGRVVPVQLSLPMGDGPPHEGTIAALRELRGAKGLRHWTALQRLWSIEGGRQGWVRWRLDDHLEAMGYGRDFTKREALRMEVAREVEALTRLELAVYDSSGAQRHRAPLVHVGDRFEQQSQDGPWRLEGMELRPNDLLYRGVRDPLSGALGREFTPVPAELAKIDHVRHPYAHALGLLFAIRARWAIGDGLSYVGVSGANLLTLAGIPTTLRADRAWDRIRREIAELQHIGLVGRVEWTTEPWTAAGVARLHLAPWILDRAARGLLPAERPPVDLPMTGAELTAWRKARSWSQREAARVLGVGQASVSRAEAAPTETLGPTLVAALKRSVDQGGE